MCRTQIRDAAKPGPPIDQARRLLMKLQGHAVTAGAHLRDGAGLRGSGFVNLIASARSPVHAEELQKGTGVCQPGASKANSTAMSYLHIVQGQTHATARVPYPSRWHYTQIGTWRLPGAVSSCAPRSGRLLQRCGAVELGEAMRGSTTVA